MSKAKPTSCATCASNKKEVCTVHNQTINCLRWTKRAGKIMTVEQVLRRLEKLCRDNIVAAMKLHDSGVADMAIEVRDEIWNIRREMRRVK